MFIGHYAAAFLVHALGSDCAWVPPLWQCFFATQLVDVLHMFFVLTDVEILNLIKGEVGYLRLDLEFVPYTHALMINVCYMGAFFFAAIVFALVREHRDRRVATPIGDTLSSSSQSSSHDRKMKKRHRRGRDLFAYVWILGGLVFSHWVGDWITHTPDLPYYPYSDKVLYKAAPKAGLGLWYYQGVSFAFELVLTLGTYFLMRAMNRDAPKLCDMIPFMFRFKETPFVKSISFGDVLISVSVTTIVLAQFSLEAPNEDVLAIMSLLTYVAFTLGAFFLWDRPFDKSRQAMAAKVAEPLKTIKVDSWESSDATQATTSSSLTTSTS